MRPAKKQSSSWCTVRTLVTSVVLVAVFLMAGVLYHTTNTGVDGGVGALLHALPVGGGQERQNTGTGPESIRAQQQQHELTQEHKQLDTQSADLGTIREKEKERVLEKDREAKEMEKEKEEAIKFADEEQAKKRKRRERETKRKEAAISTTTAASSSSSGGGGSSGSDSKDKRASVKPRKKKEKNGDQHLHGTHPDVHNHHEQFSPRNGSDIDTPAQQLALLQCHNQAKCVVPQLQLAKMQKVYMCLHPSNHGVRFYFLVKEGLLLHPNVELMESYDEALKDPAEGGADYIIYLPGSSPWHKTECTDKRQASKLIVMDEFDGASLFFPYKTAEEVAKVYGKDMLWYDMYFKRSFVQRRDGKFLNHPHLNKQDVYPLTYAITEAYLPEVFQMERSTEILCTLRGNARMQTRLRVQNWMQEYVNDTSKGVTNAVVGQINKATRSTLSKDYFDNMHNAQIIVTCIVFFFHNNNREELFEKLDYYRKNSDLARRIAIQGYLHALKYHRTVNLMDYVLRSAHLKSALLQQQMDLTEHSHEHVPEYTYTAQYLNHQTLDQKESIKKSNLPANLREVIGVHHGDVYEPHALVKDTVMPSTWH